MGKHLSPKWILLEELATKTFALPHTFTLPEAKQHHLQKVLRLEWSHPLSVTDGNGRSWTGTFEKINGSTSVVLQTLTQNLKRPHTRKLILGMPKNNTLDWILEKATECGLDELILVQTSRSVVKFHSDDSKKLQQRWSAILRTAVEQSEQIFVPKVRAPLRWSDLSSLLPEFTNELKLGFFSELRTPIDKKSFAACVGKSTVLCIGPEGGFSNEEKEFLESQNFHPTSLGTQVLRAETAVIAALTLVGFHQQ